MKKIFILMALACTNHFAFSQWATNGSNINNSNTGNVGIGTTTPLHKLDVFGTIRSETTNQLAFTTKSNLGLSLQQVNLNNDHVMAQNYLSVFSHNIHHNGTSWVRRNQYSTGWATVMSHDYYSIVFTGENPNGNSNETVSTITRMFVTRDGRVCIGTDHAGSNRLAVEGMIGASEIKVTLQRPWPDYVFAKGYNLPSLIELESFIQKNQHLPGLPSAQEITDAGGVELGDMTTKLLEKIEELTLHIIEMNKKIEKLESENVSLRK